MFQAFTWMFSTSGFKKHFLCIFIGGLLTYALAYGLIFTNISFLIPLAYLLSIIPSLYILGYYFNLINQIINRETDISANNIYNGKIKEVFKITLPEINILKNLWRGIASTFALILLIIPFAYLIILAGKSEVIQSLPLITSIIISVFLVSFLPALLWNYSNRQSVIAVWNIRKAIFLMGNYTTKYIINSVVIALCFAINYFVDILLTGFLPTTPDAMANLNPLTILIAILICILFGVKYLYFTYVNAYLIGTIAPTSEA